MVQMENLHLFVLRLLSRNPELGRYETASGLCNDDPLKQLKMMFPGFIKNVEDKRILDFGCGEGFQALAMAKQYARFVAGIDIVPSNVAGAKTRAAEMGLDNVLFCDSLSELQGDNFDVVISQNSFEHVSDPKGILSCFRELIHDRGYVYISFGPPWYSPYGAHTRMFCKFPWIHLIFREKAVMDIRSQFTDDNADKYEAIRGGLNRMSRKKFETLIQTSDFKVMFERYIYVLNLNFLKYIPFLRELFLYHINAILVPKRKRGAVV